RSSLAHSMEEALQVQAGLGFPVVIRPSFTLGGTGGGIAYNREEFTAICERGLEASPTKELLIEESLIGWKEFEMEVVRDRKDNCIIVCSIENLDPMGVHTGDSITVAPAQTLTDKEYQIMRNASIAVLREIGVDTGGSNVQFAINPADGRMIVIEMNPRVSRSSALASKATGFPIAKIAAKLAVGYTLDELKNDITGGATPASFEPSIDYVVTKVPRFAFEKFPQADDRLTTQMKSVGEVMAIGRTFQESFQKALRGLEVGVDGLNQKTTDREAIEKELGEPGPERIWYVGDAFENGFTIEEVQALTRIDRWFLAQIKDIVDDEMVLDDMRLEQLDPERLRALKRKGFSDRRLAKLLKSTEQAVRERRHALGVRPVFKRVDTCAAEFASTTAYLYSTYEEECEADPTGRRKIMVLGGGPNRIGQGIEFDYCCVHAALALRDDGFETIMVNCNPETVSTDYDTSDRLYFEPLTLEDVLEIVELEQPEGVIVQFGGQTPLKLAKQLADAGVPMWGTSVDSIDIAEDRERFGALARDHGILVPAHGTAMNEQEALAVAERIGYPVVVRPSYVLGGRAMAIVYDAAALTRYMAQAVEAAPGHPILVDHFLEDAIEIDVDAVGDGHEVVVAGVMEHIEEAGIHSGDSTTVIPPYIIGHREQDKIRRRTIELAKALNVIGLMNVQYAIYRGELYVLEVNPRASRTVPYVSKATGVSFAKIAAKVMAGETLRSLGLVHEPRVDGYFVKAPVFPFNRFPREDTLLGPEMKSTGEVMGSSPSFGEAYAKALLGAGTKLPLEGMAFISINDNDKRPHVAHLARELVHLGFRLIATAGTREFLLQNGVEAELVWKVHEARPNIIDRMINGEVALAINTPFGKSAFVDDTYIRRIALQMNVPCITTLTAATACVEGIRSLKEGVSTLAALQEQHAVVAR
ncbi:MAG: carbamoyl-phosphate synthase large subunit, partial [Acidobacteria bacterium]|nr:carbamoyl-phosphate synthase large subunit [Acidobacteriota bacterium]